MEYINNPNNDLVVEKILKEMIDAENYLLNWQAFWFEKYEDIVIPKVFYELARIEPSKLEGDNGLKIDWYDTTVKDLGSPIRRITINKIDCDACTVIWNGITTKNSKRKIIFKNNGDITLTKRNYQNDQTSYIDYKANFNVMTNDFDIQITMTTPEKDELGKTQLKYKTYTIKGQKNSILKQYKNVEIKEDKYLNRKSYVIFSQKANGKVNGIYSFTIENGEVIKANFFSRKGRVIDLKTNPILLERFNCLTGCNITSDNIDINNLEQLDKTITNALKNISEEIPITGLKQRITECLQIMELDKSNVKKKNYTN